MHIACLAWGSLIWKPEPLVLTSAWHADGPRLPIEFARVGDKGELATVLWAAAAPVPTRWARLAAANRADARELLRLRENIPPGRDAAIGDTSVAWSGPCQLEIAAWAQARGIDLVVWTALPPRFANQEGRAPSVDEAVGYLKSLQGQVREHAKHYIRHVPAEIQTRHRAEIEARLGWYSTATPS